MREWFIDGVRNTAHYVWNNIWPLTFTTGATLVQGTFTVVGVDSVLQMTGCSTGTRVVLDVLTATTLVPYAINRYRFLQGVCNSQSVNDYINDSQDSNTQLVLQSTSTLMSLRRYSKLSRSKKGIFLALFVGGNITLGFTMVGADKGLTEIVNYYVRHLSPGFIWQRDAATAFMLSLPISHFLAAVSYGYFFFAQNAMTLANVVTGGTQAFSIPLLITLGVVGTVYAIASLGLTQSNAMALLNNVIASFFVGIPSTINDSITYMGQIPEHTQIAKRAFRDSSSNRLSFWGKGATLVLYTTAKAVAKSATLTAKVGLVAGIPGGIVAAVIENGIFELPVLANEPPCVEVMPNEEQRLITDESDSVRLAGNRVPE